MMIHTADAWHSPAHHPTQPSPTAFGVPPEYPPAPPSAPPVVLNGSQETELGNDCLKVAVVHYDAAECKKLAQFASVPQGIDPSVYNKPLLSVLFYHQAQLRDIKQPEAMERLGKSQGVVLVEKAMSTMCEEIARELELAQRQGIRVLGGIVVE